MCIIGTIASLRSFCRSQSKAVPHEFLKRAAKAISTVPARKNTQPSCHISIADTAVRGTLADFCSSEPNASMKASTIISRGRQKLWPGRL